MMAVLGRSRNRRPVDILDSFRNPLPVTIVEHQRRTNPEEQYWERMKPLGRWRCCVLDCLFASIPTFPHYFNPPSNSNLHQACLEYFESRFSEAIQDSNTEKDVGVAILAAGLFTFGRLDMAEVLLDNMVSKYKTDHGAGRCVLLPMAILKDLLPLPNDICWVSLYYEGEIDIEAARSWLHKYRKRLRWDPDRGKFQLLEK